MKKLFLLITILILSTAGITPSNIDGILTLEQKKIIKQQYLQEQELLANKLRSKKELVRLNEFLFKIGKLESNNNPYSVNKFGFIGRFQFGKEALNGIGYGHINQYNFKENKSIFNDSIQTKAMILLLKRNKVVMKKYISKYKNQTIDGIYITESGILAACHLAGSGNVMRFLNSDGKENFKDAFETSLSKYLKEFSRYNFNLNLIQC